LFAPPLESLPAFLAAARLGSFSAAAVELGVTHAAISRRVFAVEQWIGLRLFERHARGASLTAAGENVARTAERSIASLIAIADDIRAANSSEMLRLSVLPSFARLWLIPRMNELMGSPPDLSIRIITEHRVASLDKREADLAVRFGSGKWPGAEAILLLKETLIPVAAPAIAAKINDPSQIQQYPLIHDGDGRDWRCWLQGAGLPYKPRAGERRFDEYDLVLAAAEAGLGIALARRPLADTFLAADRLSILQGPAVDNDRSHYVVVRAREARTSILRLRERILRAAGSNASV
jgi:DNA-binding transcriptional LysR family regulator